MFSTILTKKQAIISALYFCLTIEFLDLVTSIIVLEIFSSIVVQKVWLEINGIVSWMGNCKWNCWCTFCVANNAIIVAALGWRRCFVIWWSARGRKSIDERAFLGYRLASHVVVARRLPRSIMPLPFLVSQNGNSWPLPLADPSWCDTCISFFARRAMPERFLITVPLGAPYDNEPPLIKKVAFYNCAVNTVISISRWANFLSCS